MASYLAKGDRRLFWFEPNPTEPLLACVTASSEIDVYDGFLQQPIATHKPQHGRLVGLRWRAKDELVFGVGGARDGNEIEIWTWRPKSAATPKLVRVVADQWSAAEALRGVKIDEAKVAIPGGERRELDIWDLKMQGLFPLAFHVAASPDESFSVNASGDLVKFFQGDMQDWKTIARFPGDRIAGIRESGQANLSVTIVKSPSEPMWSKLGGVRTQLSDVGAKSVEREAYRTVFINRRGQLSSPVPLAYACEVLWAGQISSGDKDRLQHWR